MLTKNTLLLVLLLSLLYDGFVFAQQQNNDQLDYSVPYYTEDNGLFQNSVKKNSGDPRGFIRHTTEAGLVRFDGNSCYTLSIPYDRFSMLWHNKWPDLNSTNRVISIGSHKAGNHTLSVRNKNGFWQHSPPFRNIFLVVPLNWYETIWFQMVALLVILFLIYLFTRIRFRFIKKEKQLIELKIARRTRKLEQTYKALEKSEKELHRQMHIQTKLIAAMSHDIKTPLKFVSVSAGKIEGMLGNEKIDAVIKLGKMIEHSSAQMYNLLENLITYVKTQVNASTIVFKKTNLSDSLSEKLDIFKPVMEEHSNQLINEIDPSLEVWTNPQLLGIIVHNLVDNANKFSFDGIVKISTGMTNNQTQLIVSDTGPGIPDELVQWLNTPSPTDSFEKSKLFSLTYSGLGLTLVKEISVLLEIELRVEKEPGTKVHLIFPEFKTP